MDSFQKIVQHVETKTPTPGVATNIYINIFIYTPVEL